MARPPPLLPLPQMRQIGHQIAVLDAENNESMAVIEAAREQQKRQEYVGLRAARNHKEKLEVPPRLPRFCAITTDT